MKSKLEVSEDAISRQLAIEAVVCHIWHTPREVRKMFNCENYVREVVEEALERLPSVEPKRPKGEWIMEGTELRKRLRCSRCSSLAIWAPYAMSFITPNFCPYCGAKMKGVCDE